MAQRVDAVTTNGNSFPSAAAAAPTPGPRAVSDKRQLSKRQRLISLFSSVSSAVFFSVTPPAVAQSGKLLLVHVELPRVVLYLLLLSAHVV